MIAVAVTVETEDLVLVRFTRRCFPHDAGDVAELPAEQAARLVAGDPAVGLEPAAVYVAAPDVAGGEVTP